jgi:hypothetical protein
MGALPDGLPPLADGVSAANVIDPVSGSDLAILLSTGEAKRVTLPEQGWSEDWRGIHGLSLSPVQPGYLLTGASALVLLDDMGQIAESSIPPGFVALAPTADPAVYLLASEADAAEAGALSESTPFDVYLWRRGAPLDPKLVEQRVVAVASSTTGLAFLRTDDGAWSLLQADSSIIEASRPTKDRTAISPDGESLVRFVNSTTGCARETTDPCTVQWADSSGAMANLTGPALGVSWSNGELAMVLAQRDSLGLPARLIVGSPGNATNTPIGEPGP